MAMNVRDCRPVEGGHRHLTSTRLSIVERPCGWLAYHVVHPSGFELRHDVLQLVTVPFGGKVALEATLALGDNAF